MAAWEAELDELVRRRGAVLVGYAALLCGDRHQAEDLVQDALVKVFAGARRRGPADNLEGYVRRTVLTTYLDAYRRRARWAGLRHMVGSAERGPAPEDTVVAREDLAVALRGLPPRERACVVLRFYDDLTVGEIGRVLGVSDGAVKRYLSDGVHRLEERMGPLPDSRAALDTHAVPVVLRRTR